MMIVHKHHIVPKHAGGSDDPSNLIELTIEQHAEAHRVLFEKYGRWQDRIAWQTLSGQISGAEAARQKRIEVNKARKGTKKSAEFSEKIRQANLKNGNIPPKHEGVRFKKGNVNHNTGKIWINDGEKNIAIESKNTIPKGWVLGMIKKSNPQAGWNRGIFCSSETKQKISKSRKGKGSGSSNAMATEENRKKVAVSKIGRKRIYREDGSFYMSKRVA